QAQFSLGTVHLVSRDCLIDEVPPRLPQRSAIAEMLTPRLMVAFCQFSDQGPVGNEPLQLLLQSQGRTVAEEILLPGWKDFWRDADAGGDDGASVCHCLDECKWCSFPAGGNQQYIRFTHRIHDDAMTDPPGG